MVRFFKLIITSFFLCVCHLLQAQGSDGDSIIVVKGQVSDYYITISKERIIEGTVTGPDGKPLEGATVMFTASPVHYNTDADGYFRVKASKYDHELFVYYPGMKYTYHTFTEKETKINIRMQKGDPVIIDRGPGRATRWFDPANDRPSTYCNPTNISYSFRAALPDLVKNGSFRSTADPMIVVYKDEYFLFSTNQSGFYYSKDLSSWEYVYAGLNRYHEDDDHCAPAAFVRGDTLFYTGSTYNGLPIWYSTNPKSGKFKRYVEKTDLPSWDPAFLEDEDGRLYLYYGSSNEYALKGVELDPYTFHPISKIENIMMLEPDKHGWERFGMNNDDSTTLAPFTEGAFVNKYNGKYYFQYGAPGTEFKVYADGVYVSDHPLGPYTYQKHNPMSYKPGGFVQGAGHGGSFEDVYGNYWHVATCMLSLKYKFERRIGIYPTGFDKDGVMYSNTAFGDYPLYASKKKFVDISNENTFTGWMLLSYNKPVTASSVDSTLVPANAVDESMRTFWSAGSGDAGEWLQIDLEEQKEVRAIQLNFYDHRAVQFTRANDIYHQYRIYHSIDGKEWELVVDKGDNDKDVPHDYIELREPLNTRYLKVVNKHMAAGHFALSGFRVFGKAQGDKPTAVRDFKVARSKEDSRNAIISWKPVEKAYAYNIYYGTAPDKLYNTIMVIDDNSYDFRGLDAGTTYYFAIEALGESGRSEFSKTIKQ
ncbi:family 43 glycosylhydrolase [Parabacteroides sp. PF5-9]|uniref:family 43 glycosylhydrolase n=1 Tax=Parabacteroides sp. PF5-9 TaxID=1742404 RepID=UPI002473DEFD|nr:family 43 glycosylhydrolase [Parabacteroides sp. PF5-9]